MTVDELVYDDLAPFADADNNGLSLNRISATSLGSAGSSWSALVPTPGSTSIISGGVEGRYVFYNNSSFDGNNSNATTSDDLAISVKTALLPGTAATFANYTSYSRGINGLFIDIAGLGSAQLVASDFSFATGNSSVASGYQPLGIDPVITVRAGAGDNGSDRVSLVFPDGSVTETWLQVTVRANASTGLALDDVFYFGNVIGETGNTSNAIVNLTDVSLTRTNQSGFGGVGIDSLYDFDRNGQVNSLDLAIVRTNQSGFSAVRLITAPSGGSTSKTFSASSQVAVASVKSSGESLSSVAAVPTLSFELAGDDEAKDVIVTPAVEPTLIPEVAMIADVVSISAVVPTEEVEVTPTREFAAAEDIALISETVSTITPTESAERDVLFALPSFFELADFETLDEEELVV